MTNGEKFMEVFGVGCATYDVMHDITTIHRNGDWWDAEYEGEEEEPCEDFKKKAWVVIEQLRADRDRLATALEEIRDEIDRQEKWLVSAGYNAYNIDIAFDSIRKAVERKVEE